MDSRESDYVAVGLVLLFVTIWAVLFGGEPDLMDAIVSRTAEVSSDE